MHPIEEGLREIVWPLAQRRCSKREYEELCQLRAYLLGFQHNKVEPINCLEDLCEKLKLEYALTFIRRYSLSNRLLATKPLCSMLHVKDILPRLAWVEHYICLYENGE